MLDFFRPLTAEHEPDMEGQANTLPPHAPAYPTLTPSPTTNPLKRKRGQSQAVSSCSGQAPVITTAETLSHVEIPPSAAQKDPCRQRVASNSINGGRPVDMAGTMERTKGETDNLDPDCPPRPQSHDARNSQDMTSKKQRSAATTDTARVRNAIEFEFGHSIMLKHRELRLIEQELAKCQVAYEQLRRCQIIPYPAQSPELPDMIIVAEGLGQAVNNAAPHAPPWGVIEGPYSRHYAHWLIPDPAFDERTVAEDPTAPVAGYRLPDRQTRGAHSENAAAAPQHVRTHRGTPVSRSDLQEEKEAKGPKVVIVPRKSDGKLVKLVCLDDGRSNFSSVQGFINHCRISHARQFVSHEAAIQACGEEFDGEIPVVDGNAATDASTSRGPVATGLVHPMIRTARPPTPEPLTLSACECPPANKNPSVSDTDGARALCKPPTTVSPIGPQSSPSNGTPSADKGNTNVSASTPSHGVGAPGSSGTFTPSSQTPRLSGWFAKMGRDENLEEIVIEAKNRDLIDQLQAMPSEESLDEEDNEPALQSRSTRGIVQSSFRPASASAVRDSRAPERTVEAHDRVPHPALHIPPPVQTPSYSSKVDTRGAGLDHRAGYSSNSATPSNLSPNITDPHPAPSLVSDDGDFDNMQSESESSSNVDMGEAGDHYVHPGVIDQDNPDLGETSTFDFADQGKDPQSHVERQPRSSVVVHDENRGQRRVSFASPSRGKDKDL